MLYRRNSVSGGFGGAALPLLTGQIFAEKKHLFLHKIFWDGDTTLFPKLHPLSPPPF